MISNVHVAGSEIGSVQGRRHTADEHELDLMVNQGSEDSLR